MENQPNQLPARVSLPTELVNEILGFFSQMPYSQVAQLITKVQESVVPIEDIPPAVVPTSKVGTSKLKVKK